MSGEANFMDSFDGLEVVGSSDHSAHLIGHIFASDLQQNGPSITSASQEASNILPSANNSLHITGR